MKPAKKILNSMPLEIIHEILSKLIPIQRLVIRKVSCNFRYIIDEYFGIKELAIEHGNYKHPFLALKLEKGTISYMNSRSTRYACSVQVLGKRRKMKKGDSVDFVLNDLSNLMKDKVFKLDALKIEYPTWIYKDNLDVFVSTIPLILKSAKSLHVKEVEFRSGWSIEEMAQMLQCIEKVEGIEIHKPGPLDALVPLDQWKMAKSVIALDKQSLLDIGNIFHLHQFKLQLVRISREELVKIRDVLLKSTNFEYGIIYLVEHTTENIGTLFNPEYNGLPNGSMRYKTGDNNFFICFNFHYFEIRKSVENT
ncbi:F-box domain-containing protein [Caenorhabditis elegans]|uniref:F-box domain-containing protein n=1 Tax=Caenorhabditis elegans TaxID=6239 RepID=G5EEL4_CAEEL|nr:F-box domain-containing protein [Caenorhabditis elegans]CAJ43442.1 F-box domain-containing protein [Caenorhabditis elegans]|eukprot:NP_001041200.1 F-box A protein [Caenorhabditis elegans]